TTPSNGLRTVSRIVQRNAKPPPHYYAIVSGVIRQKLKKIG
ncbi:MAG: hypothetical protein ACJAS1_007027, partial [Oleiphilaceae bacterium]